MTDVRNIFEFPDFTVDYKGVFRDTRTGRVLKLSKSIAGTWKVNFYVDGKIYCRGAAKIVCSMFHGRPKPSEVVYYKDHDPLNISADNLQWKQKWWVLATNRQNKRIEARRSHRVYNETTRTSYDNALVAAKELGLIEDYILLAIANGGFYGDAEWGWAGHR